MLMPSTRRDVYRTLQRMRAILAEPSHWCQHHGGQDARGQKVPSLDPRAVSWCLVGCQNRAIIDLWNTDTLASTPSIVLFAVDRYLESELWAQLTEQRYLARFNDSHTHHEILAFLDAAIAQANPELS